MERVRDLRIAVEAGGKRSRAGAVGHRNRPGHGHGFDVGIGGNVAGRYGQAPRQRCRRGSVDAEIDIRQL